MKIFKNTVKIVAFALIVGILAFFIYFVAVTANVRLEKEKLSCQNVTMQLFDKDETLITTNAALPNCVPFDDFPKPLIHAFIATEDRRFFSHRGFDVKRMVAALVKNVTSLSMKEGASTISQQLIKNTHLTGEKTIKRKLQEIKLTAQLEREYSKEEIFQKYLNTIYFGHNLFGIADASNFYFDCKVQDLSIGQCAMLAGLVRSPNNYSPFKHPNRALQRRNAVLNFMRDEGYLTHNEYDLAKSESLPTVIHKKTDDAYCQYVYNEAESILEKQGVEISGKIIIKTYLDKQIQKNLTASLQKAETNKIGGVLDNDTGGFVAFLSDVGNIKRSPASTIKPLCVYAPALQENILSPATPILDEAVDFSGYTPKNYDEKYRGYVSVRESLSKSLNVPAVKILNALSVKKASNYLQKLHLPIEEEDEHLALALGGMKEGFTLPQLLSAYATFPRQGIYLEGVFIKEIVKNGTTLYRHRPIKEKVFEEDTSYLITDILQDCRKNGTAKKLKSLPFSIAAKTGTAGINNKNTDAYAISYTTGYTMGVWLGYADNSPIPHSGGGLPCSILYDINEYLYNNTNKEKFNNFPQPNNVVRVKLDKIAYQQNHNLVLADDCAEKSYIIEDLCRISNLPHQKSAVFSLPSIPAPTILYQNKRAIIRLHKNSPTFYRYKIEKICDDKKRIVYFGEYSESIIDGDVKANKNYIYTITPYYKERAGETIILPKITTKEPNSTLVTPPQILEKPWWQY